MKKSLLPIVAVMVIAAAVITIFTHNNDVDGEVIATVNGVKIGEGDIEKQLKKMSPNAGTLSFDALDPDSRTTLVKELYLQKHLAKEAEKSGVYDTEEVKTELENYRDMVGKQAYLQQLGEELVSDEDVQARYDELKKQLEGKKEVNASHILVKTRDEAKAVLAEVKSKDFAAVAQEKSLDPGSAKNGGNLGYFLKGQMVKEFEDVVFNAEKGKILGPIKTQFGWHVIRVEDKRDAQPAPLEIAKPRIVRELSQQKLQAHITALVEGLDEKIEFAEPAEEKAETEAKADEGAVKENADNKDAS